VVTTGIKAYEQLLHDTLFKLPGVTHLRSSIVLKEVKADVALPLVAAGAGSVQRAHRRARP